MRRTLLVLAIVVTALSSYAAAQGLVARCGTVKNNSDFSIVVYVKANGALGPVAIGPHDSARVCAGR
jgi:hypothetical protein